MSRFKTFFGNFLGILLRDASDDALDFGVVLQAVLAVLAAMSRHLVTAERRLSAQDVVSVDPDRACSQALHDVVDFIDVLGENGGGQSVLAAVGSLNHFVQLLEANDLLDRAEDFLFGDRHVVVDIGEHRRLDEKSFACRKKTFKICFIVKVILQTFMSLSSRNQLRSLLLARLNQSQNLLLLLSVDLRALLDAQVKRISHAAALRALGGSFDELVVNLILDERAGASTTALTHVEEEPEVRSLDSVRHVRIGQDDVRRFAAKLQRGSLQRPSRSDLNQLSDLRGTGECDLVDVGMVHELRARLAKAWKHVDDSIGESRLAGQLRDVKSGQGSLLGRFENDDVAGGERWSQLPCHHQHREVPRDDLRADADGFVARVNEELAVHRDHFAVVLVRVAGVVAKIFNRQRKIDVVRH